MKTHRQELWFHATKRRQIFNITTRVESAVTESGVREGLVLVNAMHITASVFINDDEGGLHRDWERWLEKLAPEKPYNQYEHNGSEDNADAHLKRTIMGREVVVAITAGKLDLGPWNRFLLRTRRQTRQARAGQDHRGMTGARSPVRAGSDSVHVEDFTC